MSHKDFPPFKDRFDIKDKFIGGTRAGTVVTPIDNTTVEPDEEEALLEPFKDRFGRSIKVVGGILSGSVSTPLSTAFVSRSILSSTDSGSNLSSTDHLRQGVEIINSSHRVNRILPVLGSGRSDHNVEQVIFGVPNKINKIEGSVEPLTIRDVVLGKSTFEIEPHSVKGSFQDGNDDEFGRSNKIEQIFDKTPLTESKPYIDSTELFGNSSTGSIKIVGQISEIVPKIKPFNETSFDNFIVSSFSGSLSNIFLSMSLGRSGSYRDFGLIPHNKKSATAGFIYNNAIEIGTDSLSFGDMQEYQRRGFLQQLDSITGSIPTNLRTGDRDRKGNFKIRFDDTRTVTFEKNKFIDVQRNLQSGSIYLNEPFLSQSIDVNKKSRFYPFLGQKNIVRATSASIYATGTVRRGVADKQLRFDDFGGEDLSPFIEDGLFENKEDSFWATGSSVEDVGIGLLSPLLSKTKVEIDLAPNEITVFGMNNDSSDKLNYPMVYWNNKLKKWEGVGTGKAYIASPNSSEIVENLENQMIGFSPSSHWSSPKNTTARLQTGLPMTNFGFPVHSKFHATSSQIFNLSSSISHPFVIEKIVYEFSCSYNDRARSSRGSEGPTSNFFILNQRERFNINHKFESEASNGNIYQLSSSLPQNQILSAGGDIFKIKSIRDLVTFAQTTFIQDVVTSSIIPDLRRDLNISGLPDDYLASGTFILSSSVRSSTRNIKSSIFLNGNLLFSTNDPGGRNGLALPTGRDFANSVLGSELSGSYTDFSTTIFPSKTRFVNNPYILLPNDNLIFGWQVPFDARPEDNVNYPQMAFYPSKGKLILYGSLLRDRKEFHDTLNQPLTSKAITHVVGDDLILDEYDTEYFQMLSGSYIDDIVSGSMDTNTPTNRKVVGSIFGQNGSQSGSFSRNVQLTSCEERYFDTLVPRPEAITSINGGQVAFSDTTGLNVIILNDDIGGGGAEVADHKWTFSFPFEARFSELKRGTFNNIKTTAEVDLTNNSLGQPKFQKTYLVKRYGIGATISRVLTGDESLSNTISPKLNDFIKHYYGFGDSVSGSVDFERQNAQGNLGIGAKEQRGWKYGLLNGLPQHNKVYFRRDRYGQFRDMMEQRRDGKFLFPDGTISESPVQVKFIGGDPSLTFSSNLSFEATSSLPYFDGIVRNREDPLNTDISTEIESF